MRYLNTSLCRKMLMFMVILALSAFHTHTLWAKTLSEGKRVALVIGNANYPNARLKNPLNDAHAITQSLREMGFTVILGTNVNRDQSAELARQFGEHLRGAQIGLFYYAGHGLQVRGKNYLVPIDANIAHEDEVPYRSLDVGQILDKMDSARTTTNIVILDACRNNPFGQTFRPSLRGLAQIDAPPGTLIAFATSPGNLALDGEGIHGVYTQALLKHMHTPDLSLEQLFKRVRIDVMQASKNQQIPWDSSSLTQEFAFVSATPTPPPPLPTIPLTDPLKPQLIHRPIEAVSPEGNYRLTIQNQQLEITLMRQSPHAKPVRTYPLQIINERTQFTAIKPHPNGRFVELTMTTDQNTQIQIIDLLSGQTMLK